MMHLLPHERMDLFKKGVKKLESMTVTLVQEKCVCSKAGSTKNDESCEEDESKEEKEKCMWPTNHEDKNSKGKM